MPSQAKKHGAKKVFVGLSGGVDSAVSAVLLKNAGYDVTGVFIKVWQPDWIECTWKEDRLDAMRVAAHLDIPFVTLNLEKRYKEEVIDYMLAEYKAGRTPNPDVMCNKEVKFGAFYDWAMDRGADYVATGHYAIIAKAKRKKEEKKPYYELSAGVDRNKDQSYFLWNLKQEQLSHVLFPIGGMTKPDVRKIASRLKLSNAAKKDSQGLCFIGEIDFKEFLSHYAKLKQGKVLDQNGKVVGTHPGAILFTIGERHGFTIKAKTSNDMPLFVIDKDMAKNTITVAPDTVISPTPQPVEAFKRRARAYKIAINDTNWIANTPIIGQKVSVRARYRQTLAIATIVGIDSTSATIELHEPIDYVAYGQSLVAYVGEECLGGGVIINVE